MVTTLPVKRAVPAYWEEACKHLAKKDRVMRRLIPQFGDACLESRGDAFVTLARSIVGQQISVKAAQSVWDKFAALPKKNHAGLCAQTQSRRYARCGFVRTQGGVLG